jgi:hypothetical protein
MALQKEIWLNHLVEQLFADNTFAARSVDHSIFVDNKTVHVPNAGNAPGVVKDRNQWPAQVTQREDSDLDYDLHEYSTDPVHLQYSEEIELSYKKRDSIVGQSKSALADNVHADLIKLWTPEGYAKIGTTGAAVASHLVSTTGNRQAMTKDDVLSTAMRFDLDSIPDMGRCMLLDAVMYNQLLASLTESESNAFLATADAKRGIVGQLYGFDFYKRSTVLRTAANGATLAATNAATNAAAALAWSEYYVGRALGEQKLFENENDATYYGTVMSALVRAGGSYIRKDKKGIAVIYQVTP